MLDRHKSPAKPPLAHYEGTAEEIFEQSQGKLDCMVVSSSLATPLPAPLAEKERLLAQGPWEAPCSRGFQAPCSHGCCG